MDSEPGLEKTSLWGVLHDGHLNQLHTDAEHQTAELQVLVSHLNDFHGWDTKKGIKFSLAGVTELKIAQWIPEPVLGNEDIRSRRWTKREWSSFESVVPPHSLEILEASLYEGPQACRVELAGYEHDEDGQTNVWLELTIQAKHITFSTPDGPCDLDRLLQLGDAYWDNFGKKRKR